MARYMKKWQFEVKGLQSPELPGVPIRFRGWFNTMHDDREWQVVVPV